MAGAGPLGLVMGTLFSLLLAFALVGALIDAPPWIPLTAPDCLRAVRYCNVLNYEANPTRRGAPSARGRAGTPRMRRGARRGRHRRKSPSSPAFRRWPGWSSASAAPCVEVGVLVQPGQNPHLFQPSPRQVVAVEKGGLFFKIGMPFESRLVERIESRPSVPRRDRPRGSTSVGWPSTRGRRRAGRRAPRGRRGRRPDPHVWLSPRNLKIMAANVAAALGKADPRPAADYPPQPGDAGRGTRRAGRPHPPQPGALSRADVLRLPPGLRLLCRRLRPAAEVGGDRGQAAHAAAASA